MRGYMPLKEVSERTFNFALEAEDVMVCVVFWCVSLCFPPVLITAPSPNVSQLFLVACLVFAT